MVTDTERNGTSEADRLSLSKLALVFATLAAGVLVIAGSVVGNQLGSIIKLADETRDTTIPDTVRQNALALDAERLGRLADIAFYADEETERALAMKEVDVLVAKLVNAGDEDLRAKAITAGEIITETASATSWAAALTNKIASSMKQLDRLIGEIDDNLTVIVEDSSYRLRLILEESSVLTLTDMDNIRTDFRETVRINTASQQLLSILRANRNLLALSVTLNSEKQIENLQAKFDASLARTTELLGYLPTSGEFEYLPDLIDEFAESATILESRIEVIEERRARGTAIGRRRNCLRKFARASRPTPPMWQPAAYPILRKARNRFAGRAICSSCS